MSESEGDTEAEFRQYLVQSQAATELLKVLVGLEEADPKPENPVQFLTDFFGSQARRRCILWLSRALAALEGEDRRRALANPQRPLHPLHALLVQQHATCPKRDSCNAIQHCKFIFGTCN